MSIPYKDLELSFCQMFTLRRIRITKIKNDKVFCDKYKFLKYYHLVVYYPKNHNYLILSDKGKMLLRHKRKDRFRYWVPIIISIIALFGGYGIYTIPLLEQLLQAIASLAKTITETLGAFF